MKESGWRGKRLPVWISAPLVLGAFGLLVWREIRRPLRSSVEPKLRRNVRNLAMAGISAAVVQLAAAPVLQPLTRMAERRRWGLLRRLGLPVWIEVPLGVVLLDYSLYLWHVLNHRAPFLWRFHQVHHVDLDLDASTALRFHFGELTMSVAWNSAEVVLLGISPLTLSVRQTLLMISILFHHSNAELPEEVERRLVSWVVTPRMHGIHHSAVQEETDSNWSSGLTVWDRLHGTLRLDVPQEEITIGVPAYRDPEEVTLPKIVALPFGEQRPTWELPPASS
ncbi:MAG TPA: sterol desaturase family protein [Thermoanaerobaculia bacterium]|nr:sterol desaturase family protein [Thermoanaerobaculia bacterium]